MKQTILIAVPLLVAAGAAFASPSTIHGNGALMLASIVGRDDPQLTHAEKAVLSHFLAGDTGFSTSVQSIRVNASKITCRMGDVSLVVHSCELTFAATTVTHKGLDGQALLATMQENGVMANGAAGTIYYSVAPLTCTIDVAQVQSNGGGGVTCTYTNA